MKDKERTKRRHADTDDGEVSKHKRGKSEDDVIQDIEPQQKKKDKKSKKRDKQEEEQMDTVTEEVVNEQIKGEHTDNDNGLCIDFSPN